MLFEFAKATWEIYNPINLKMKGDTRLLVKTNQGNWLTATGFNTVVPPSVAQFNARTIPSADYFDPAIDTVANVTLVATTTLNTDMVAEAPTVSDILTTQMKMLGCFPSKRSPSMTFLLSPPGCIIGRPEVSRPAKMLISHFFVFIYLENVIMFPAVLGGALAVPSA